MKTADFIQKTVSKCRNLLNKERQEEIHPSSTIDDGIDNSSIEDEFKFDEMAEITEPVDMSVVLSEETVTEEMLDLVKNNKLDESEQHLLLTKKNVKLLEAYLSPKGYFDVSRRFVSSAEYEYIISMVKENCMDGVEIFKAYVDNTFRNLWSESLFKELIKYDSFASRYVLQRAKLRHDYEEYFVENASVELIKAYVAKHAIMSEEAQVKLVEKHFALAKDYFYHHGFKGEAMYRYQELRRQATEQ